MSKIVAVMGSPNSAGNTASVVDTVLNGAMGLSTNMIKYHCLAKLNFVHGCTYCHRCIEAGKCVLEDDLTSVLEDIRNSDTLIIATPSYFNMPTAQIKTVIDRLYAYENIERTSSSLAGKRAVVIVTCSEINEDSRHLVNILAKCLESFGIIVTDRLLFCDNHETITFRSDRGAMAKAYAVGAAFSTRESNVAVNPEIAVLNSE